MSIIQEFEEENIKPLVKAINKFNIINFNRILISFKGDLLALGELSFELKNDIDIFSGKNSSLKDISEGIKRTLGKMPKYEESFEQRMNKTPRKKKERLAELFESIRGGKH